MTDSGGLLASPGLNEAPVKGVYFFPGEGSSDRLGTTYPLDHRDRRWNSDPSIYYLLSLSSPYQVQLMHSRLRLD
jgi:hypothetical protein